MVAPPIPLGVGAVVAEGGGTEQAAAASDAQTLGTLPQSSNRSGRARREAVMSFVHEQIPELEKVLATAEQNYPERFKYAIGRISKAIARLEKIKKNQPAKFEVSVEQWRIKTRMEVAVAQYAHLETDEQLMERLMPMVKELIANRREMLLVEKENTEKRLERIERWIERIDQKPEVVIRSNLRPLQESAEKIRAARKGPVSVFKGIKSFPNAQPRPRRWPIGQSQLREWLLDLFFLGGYRLSKRLSPLVDRLF